MIYANPLTVICRRCGAEQQHAVSSLMNFSAACIDCGENLRHAGQAMHETISKGNIFLGKVLLALEIEEALGLTVLDEDMEKASNLVEFATRLSQRNDPCGVSIESIVREGRAFLCRRQLMHIHDGPYCPFEELFSRTESGNR